MGEQYRVIHSIIKLYSVTCLTSPYHTITQYLLTPLLNSICIPYLYPLTTFLYLIYYLVIYPTPIVSPYPNNATQCYIYTHKHYLHYCYTLISTSITQVYNIILIYTYHSIPTVSPLCISMLLYYLHNIILICTYHSISNLPPPNTH